MFKPIVSKYKPVISIIFVSIGLTLTNQYNSMLFMGYFLVSLSLLKLIDIDSFAISFSKYDLVAKKISAYSYMYPFLELFSGLSIISISFKERQINSFLNELFYQPFIIGLLIFLIGFIGSISIIKAVYIDKLNFNCACVGGNSKVPLGFVSLIENISMAIMGLYLILLF